MSDSTQIPEFGIYSVDDFFQRNLGEDVRDQLIFINSYSAHKNWAYITYYPSDKRFGSQQKRMKCTKIMDFIRTGSLTKVSVITSDVDIPLLNDFSEDGKSGYDYLDEFKLKEDKIKQEEVDELIKLIR